jgi:hypothetical protein
VGIVSFFIAPSKAEGVEKISRQGPIKSLFFSPLACYWLIKHPFAAI